MSCGTTVLEKNGNDHIRFILYIRYVPLPESEKLARMAGCLEGVCERKMFKAHVWVRFLFLNDMSSPRTTSL